MMPISKAHVRAGLLVFLIGMSSGIPISTVAPSMVPMATDLMLGSKSAFLAQMVLMMPALAMLISAPFTGLIAERIGYKRTVVLGLLGFLLFGLAGLVLSNIWLMIPCRFISGVAGGAVGTAGCALIPHYFEGSVRDRLFGFMSGSSGIFSIIGSLVAGILVRNYGWHSVYALFGLAILPLLLMPILEEVRGSVAPAESTQKNQTPAESRKLPLLGMGCIFFMSIWVAILGLDVAVQVPFMLKEMSLDDPRYVSTMVALNGVFMIVGSVLYGWLAMWLTIRQRAAVLLALTGLGHVLMGAGGTFPTLIIATVLIGMPSGFSKSISASYLFVVSPPSIHGRVSGLLLSSLFLGAFLNPFVVSPVVAVMGFGSTFILFGGLTVVGAVVAAASFIKFGPAVAVPSSTT